jgi:hypothetical protein
MKRELVLSDEWIPALHTSGAVVCGNLMLDTAYMPIKCAGSHTEPPSYALLGQTSCNQSGYFPFTPGEPHQPERSLVCPQW